jgi:hypothetical protein
LFAAVVEVPLNKPAPMPEAEAKEVLQAVCPGPIAMERDSDDKGAWGCATCPAYVIQGEWPFGWDLQAVHYGHFTAAEADEAALAMGGCEPHSMSFGATVLLTRVDGQWRMKWFESGLITSRCAAVQRNDKRDLLVCETEDIHQGVADRDLFTVDFSRKPGARQTRLLDLHGDANNCGENSGKVLQTAEFLRVAFDSESARLSVDTEYGQRSFTPAETRACRAAQDKNTAFPSTQLIKTKVYPIEFGFDGEKFMLSPASAQNKRVVEKLPPDW